MMMKIKKNLSIAPQKGYGLFFFAVYATKFWKAAGSNNRKVVHV